MKEYMRLRAMGWRAVQAFHSAKVLAEWDMADGFEIAEYDRHIDSEPGASLDCPGPVRLRLVPDDTRYDDSYIDTWHDVSENKREQVRRELWARIEQDGVCGVIGEYWNGQEWEHADSCFGFVGDDWRDSGYDCDIMAETLEAWNRHLESAAREIENARPDMYQGVAI